MHTTVTQIAERCECYFCVIERNSAAGENLLFLVTFARNEDDVVGLCGFESKMNGRGAIGLDSVARASGSEAGFDFSQDGERIFTPGIVAGGDNEVTSLARSATHLGTLGAVAIATASEERDNAAAGVRGELAGQRR